MPAKFPNIFQNPGYGPSGSVYVGKSSQPSRKLLSWEVLKEVGKIGVEKFDPKSGKSLIKD